MDDESIPMPYIRAHGAGPIRNFPRVLAVLRKLQKEGVFGQGLSEVDIYPNGLVGVKLDGQVLVVSAESPKPRRQITGYVPEQFVLQLLPLDHPGLGGVKPGSWIE